MGVGASLSLRGGFTAGLAANGSIAHARDEMSGIENLNARLDAGETLTIVTGRHATLAGADATGRDVLLDIGGDLTVASRQDTGHGSSHSSSVGGSLFIGGGTSPISGSISVGGGRGSSDRAWVNDQTSIVARETLDARVGGHTQIDGAVIASLTGDLTLDTGTLGFSDLHDRDRGSSWSAEAGLSFAIDRDKGDKGRNGQGTGQNAPTANGAGGDKPGYTAQGRPTGASLSGHVAEHDRAEETRATVGAGTIVIRDTEKQTQDVAALNGDLDRHRRSRRTSARASSSMSPRPPSRRSPRGLPGSARTCGTSPMRRVRGSRKSRNRWSSSIASSRRSPPPCRTT